MVRILLVDNGQNLLEDLVGYLPSDGYEISVIDDNFESIESRLFADKSNAHIDLVVADLKPHKASGFDLLRKLRNITDIPVIAIIDNGSDIDRIVSLEVGADDCLSKPFDPRELLARIHSVFRRVDSRACKEINLQSSNGVRRLQVNDIEMDIRGRTVQRSGEIVELTSTEFGLLECFLKKPGELVPKELLCERVLGRPLIPGDRSLDVHISKLRKKLGNSICGLERIKAIRGEGYLYTVFDTDRNC